MSFDDQLQNAASRRVPMSVVNDWDWRTPFLFGPNYVSANAGSPLEFWSKPGFHPRQIDRELGKAQAMGVNTLRVFVNALSFQHDEAALRERMDTFLDLTDRHGIKPMFVPFDSCWGPEPEYGKHPKATRGVHNSSWFQSPASKVLRSDEDFARLEPYVRWMAEVTTDRRTLGVLDIYNEPSNMGGTETGTMAQKSRADTVAPRLLQVAGWVRNTDPRVLITTGLWRGEVDDVIAGLEQPDAAERAQLAVSDVRSGHSYEWDAGKFLHRFSWLAGYDPLAPGNAGETRPVICTEFGARGNLKPGERNTVEELLPRMKAQGLKGANPWGWYQGKTQTYEPWSPDARNGIPHHDLLDHRGKPLYPSEAAVIRQVMQGETFMVAQERYFMRQEADRTVTAGTADPATGELRTMIGRSDQPRRRLDHVA